MALHQPQQQYPKEKGECHRQQQARYPLPTKAAKKLPQLLAGDIARPQVTARKGKAQPQRTLFPLHHKKGRPLSCHVRCASFSFVFILLFVLSAKAFHGDIETALLGKASDLP